ASYTYSPFGEVLLKEGPFDSRYQFSTKEYDEPTAMNYYGYRFYNPELGRWINRDPRTELGFRVVRIQSQASTSPCFPSSPDGGLSNDVPPMRMFDQSYTFALNNPVIHYDPLGLVTQVECDMEYEDCINGCRGLCTTRERALCYSECMVAYATCLGRAVADYCAKHPVLCIGTGIGIGIVIHGPTPVPAPVPLVL
ncbi:MAG: RHS repeat-associated core domain-containing protein, partial [Verrucomicrobiota bacterium]|nr:RHS repeat-associated core domain-containing protein [Verrucomicrobiota bacterium]